MFEPNSRYFDLETAKFKPAEGRAVAYKRRRFLPHGDAMPLLMEVTVQQDERLDHIAARATGGPEQFWRVCDANNAMNPEELVAVPGRRLRLPMPEA